MDPIVTVTIGLLDDLLVMNAVGWWWQKHDECMQAMENDLRKERASVKRADLDKAHAEQKIASVEASMVL